jgi:predicted CoA-binding protein
MLILLKLSILYPQIYNIEKQSSFNTLASIPQPCNIRIMPVFKNPEDVRDIVRCCPNHTMDNVEKTSKFETIWWMHELACYNILLMFYKAYIASKIFMMAVYLLT